MLALPSEWALKRLILFLWQRNGQNTAIFKFLTSVFFAFCVQIYMMIFKEHFFILALFNVFLFLLRVPS